MQLVSYPFASILASVQNLLTIHLFLVIPLMNWAHTKYNVAIVINTK